MMLSTLRTMTLALTVFAVAACGSGSESTDGSAPFHPVPDDAVVVSGTATCEFSEDGTDADGGPGFLVVCELDLTDPRVSGTERHDRFRFVTGRGAGQVWLVEDATIVNNEGTWRGSAQAAENTSAIPSGEAHYVGEDAYEGLRFHYYFFHDDLASPAEIRGWISNEVSPEQGGDTS